MPLTDTISTVLHSPGGAGITLRESDGTAMEGAVISADGNSSPWSVPWAVKGVGLVFELGARTAGSIRPRLEVTFDGEAASPTFFVVPDDAGTTSAIQVNQIMDSADEQIFEWFGCHVPASGSYDKSGHSTRGPDVQFRVNLVGASSPNLVLNQAKVFMIRSVE